MKSDDDLGQLLIAAAHIQPAPESEAAAKSYGGAELWAAEQKREADQKARVAELRRRFVEGPVLALPGSRNFTFATAGITSIPEGTVYPNVRATDDWGSLEATSILLSTDRNTITVPAPQSTEGTTITGEGWTLKPAPGWGLRSGRRKGDLQLAPLAQ